MAKNPPAAADADTVNNDVATTVATPENTPIPGGGSWSWDTSLPGWTENAAYAPTPINQPIQE